MNGAKIAVLIPCYNEEMTIGDVVHEFRAQLPNADIYVLDNNSSDRTAARARHAGAIVLSEPRQGKGHHERALWQVSQGPNRELLKGKREHDGATSSHGRD